MGHAVISDQLDARQWLEMQVGLLADGTIDPVEQPMVEAAVVSDPSLQVLLANQRDVNAILRRSPDLTKVNFAGLTAAVMSNVRADLAAGGRSDEPLSLPQVRPAAAAFPAVPAAGAWNLARTIRWSGVAAALVVGVGVGAVLLQNGQPAVTNVPAPSDNPSLLVELGNQTVGVDPTKSDGGDGNVAVDGPALVADGSAAKTLDSVLASQPDANGTVADSTLNVHSNYPDYSNAGVPDPLRRAAVTAGNGTAVADANKPE